MRHQSGDTVAGADMGGLPQYTSIQPRHLNTTRASQYSQGTPIQPSHPPGPNTSQYSNHQKTNSHLLYSSSDLGPLKIVLPARHKVYCYLCSTLQAYPSIITFCQFQSQTNNNTFSKSKEQSFTQNNFR